jgi:carbamoyltransferase
MGNYPRIVHWAKKYGREQISAAFQIVLEEVATQYVAHYVRATGVGNICLAGGVFANVKLNQRIHELEGVENVFVFPHMADGGLGYGAAQMIYREKTGDPSPSPITDVYWGPSYSNDEVKSVLDRYPVRYTYYDHIEPVVAKHIADKKVVARFAGRMEFGPRALGNRSVLYSAHDPSVNDWLNAKLKRSEFMPFAPVTLAEHAESCYIGLKGVEKTAEYMTVTLDCKDRIRKQAPACVHVDGTARPQLVRREINPGYYGVLEEYLKLTGSPCLVNTSFNMHEEPIVCSPDDGVRAFLEAELDYLAMENFLVEAVRS